MKQKVLSKINKIDKPLTKLIKRKREKIQLTKIGLIKGYQIQSHEIQIDTV
jgi:hypothetical protein